MKVFPLYYFPPVHWYAAVSQEEKLLIDWYQPYRKQRYFSRMVIRGANQLLPLVIPVERRSKRIALKEKRISNAEDWQSQHWRSLVFAYKNSPYFEFYQDTLAPLYTQPYELLTSFLLDCLQKSFQLLQFQPDFSFTDTYLPGSDFQYDYRKDFEPGTRTLPIWYKPIAYEQVFGEFEPGLSILDLLFNKGPESKGILLASFEG